MDMIQKQVSYNFPLRIIPLKIFQFTPTKGRMLRNKDFNVAIKNQEIIINVWKNELNKRFNSDELKQSTCDIKIKD